MKAFRLDAERKGRRRIWPDIAGASPRRALRLALLRWGAAIVLVSGAAGFLAYLLEPLSWPKVAGEITRTRVVTMNNGRHEMAVHYDYQVDGRTLTGDSVRFSEVSFRRHENARAALGDYVIGSRVWVYHDPALPERSVLDPRPRAGVLLLIAFLIGYGCVDVIGTGLKLAAARRRAEIGRVDHRLGEAAGERDPGLLEDLRRIALGATRKLGSRPRNESNDLARVSPVRGRLVLVGLMLLVGAGAYATFVMGREVARVARWPKTAGVVMASSVAERRDGADVEYAAEVEYRYEIGADTLVGSGPTLERKWTRRRSEASAAAGRYKEGAGAWVWYDPADPSRTTLERFDGLDRTLVSAALTGLGVLAMGHVWMRVRVAERRTRIR